MAFPDPLPSSGQLKFSEIKAWMIAAGEAAAGDSSLLVLKGKSHLASTVAPAKISDWYGYAPQQRNTTKTSGSSSTSFISACSWSGPTATCSYYGTLQVGTRVYVGATGWAFMGDGYWKIVDQNKWMQIGQQGGQPGYILAMGFCA